MTRNTDIGGIEPDDEWIQSPRWILEDALAEHKATCTYCLYRPELDRCAYYVKAIEYVLGAKTE